MHPCLLVENLPSSNNLSTNNIVVQIGMISEDDDFLRRQKKDCH